MAGRHEGTKSDTEPTQEAHGLGSKFIEFASRGRRIPLAFGSEADVFRVAHPSLLCSLGASGGHLGAVLGDLGGRRNLSWGNFPAGDIFGALGLLWRASLQASGRRSEGAWQGPKVAYVCRFRASREEQGRRTQYQIMH